MIQVNEENTASHGYVVGIGGTILIAFSGNFGHIIYPMEKLPYFYERMRMDRYVTSLYYYEYGFDLCTLWEILGAY